MERAKRLELTGENPDQISVQNISENQKSGNSQLATHELHRSENAGRKCPQMTKPDRPSLPTEATEFSSELREVVERWLNLNPAIQQAILSIVRASLAETGTLTVYPNTAKLSVVNGSEQPLMLTWPNTTNPPTNHLRP